MEFVPQLACVQGEFNCTQICGAHATAQDCLSYCVEAGNQCKHDVATGLIRRATT